MNVKTQPRSSPLSGLPADKQILPEDRNVLRLPSRIIFREADKTDTASELFK
jgi:hypothetical protein